MKYLEKSCPMDWNCCDWRPHTVPDGIDIESMAYSMLYTYPLTSHGAICAIHICYGSFCSSMLSELKVDAVGAWELSVVETLLSYSKLYESSKLSVTNVYLTHSCSYVLKLCIGLNFLVLLAFVEAYERKSPVPVGGRYTNKRDLAPVLPLIMMSGAVL